MNRQINIMMTTTIINSIKVRLKPNKTQEKQLQKSSGTSRFIYNWALNIQIENYKSGNKFISDGDLRKQLTQLKKTEEYSWLYGVSNNIAKQAIKDLCKSYKTFFNVQKNPKTKSYSQKTIQKAKRQGKELTSYDLIGHPKFKSRKHSKSSFYNDTEALEIKDNKRVLIEKVGWIKTSEQIPMTNLITNHKIKYLNPRISYDGKYWYLSVSFEQQLGIEQLKSELTDESIGIDLGISKLAHTSDNKIYPNINKTKTIRKLKKKLKQKQKQVSRKYQMNKTIESSGKQVFHKTKNIIKKEKEIKLLNRRIGNIRTNNLHQVTTEIAKTKPKRVVMEDLNVVGMMKNRHLSKAIGEQCWNKFTVYMKYKSERQGTEFVEVDRYYPSSKMCSNCNNKHTELKLSDRVYRCQNPECNLHKSPIDRDYNASLNLSGYIIPDVKTG